MRRAFTTFSLVALATVAAACTTSKPQPPENPQSLVNQRVAIMKGLVGGLGASSQYSQGKVSLAAARTKLTTARSGLDRVGDLFVPGTALGDRGVTQSRALSTIFTNRSDFDAKLDELSSAFAELDAAVSRDDKAGAGKAIQRTKNACLACHNRYRTPDES